MLIGTGSIFCCCFGCLFFIVLLGVLTGDPQTPPEEPRYITTWEELDFEDPDMKPGLYSPDG